MKRIVGFLNVSISVAIVATLFGGHGRVIADADTTSTPPPTYQHDVRRIVDEHCASCHRPGGSTPFSLTTYRDVEKRAQQITQITQARVMPPWAPDSHGEFVGENKLTASEIDALQKWAADAAEGTPAVSRTTEGVKAAKPEPAPDAVLIPTSGVSVPAAGPDFFQCYILPTHFVSDKYILAIVFEPGNNTVVDHALEYVDPLKMVRFRNQVAGGASFVIRNVTTGLSPSMVVGGWGRSTPVVRYPVGSGILLPKGADIVVQAHYRSTGKPEVDRPRILLYLSHTSVDKPVRVAPVLARNLRLVPGLADMVAGGQAPVKSTISILSVLPYLHRTGADINLNVLLADMSTRPILSIPHWDFDWVGQYTFRKPVSVPAGSLLAMDAAFGNSSAPKGSLLTWGDRPEDENAVVYVFYTAGKDGPGVPPVGGARDAAMTHTLLKMFDINRDGIIDRRESIQMRQYFKGSMPSMGMEM